MTGRRDHHMKKYLCQMLIADTWICDLMFRSEIIKTLADDRKGDFLSAIIVTDPTDGNLAPVNLFDLVSEEEILAAM